MITFVTDNTDPRIGRAASLARLAGALAHKVRVELLELLKEHPRSCSTDLSKLIGMAHSIVAQHLKVMRESGLITGIVIGKRVAFFVNHENLSLFHMIVSNIAHDIHNESAVIG